MNSKSKKILIGIGVPMVITSIAIPLAIIFTKSEKSKEKDNSVPSDSPKLETDSTPNTNQTPTSAPKISENPSLGKKNKTFHYKNDEVRSKVFDLLQLAKSSAESGKIPVKNIDKLFSDENKHDTTTLLISNLLKSGIKNIDFNNLQLILDNFNVSKKISKIIKSVFLTKDNKTNHELLDLLFNRGIAKINNPKYKDQKDNVINIVKQFIPSSLASIISLKELEKIVFTGFSEDDFNNLLTRIINEKMGFGGSTATWVVEKEIKEIYSFLPIIKNGIINASPSDWIKTFLHFKDLANYSILGFGLSTFVEDKKGLQDNWQILNVIKNIANQINYLATSKDESKKTELDTIAEALSNIFSKGINSLNQAQSLQISNIIEWALNFKQREIYKVDLKAFKLGIINSFKGLSNKEAQALNFNKINNSNNLNAVVKAAKLIEAHKFVRPSDAIVIPAQDIYKSLDSKNRILELDIKDDEGFFSTDFGLKSTINKIISDYYDKQGNELPDKHPKIENLFTQFSNDKNKNENNFHEWWDKMIDAAKSIETFDKEGNQVVIDWPKAFKDIDSDYEPDKDYNVFANSIVSKFLEKNYYFSDDININDKLTAKEFLEARKTFNVKPILDKINSLFRNKLYENKTVIHKIDLNSKIDQFLENNINSYRFHQRKLSTINEYRSNVKKSLNLYKTKSQPSDAKANQNIDLSELDNEDLEGVQQIYDVAKSILDNTSNGIWNTANIKQDITNNEILKLIIPQIPLRDYAYNLNKDILNKSIKEANRVDIKIIHFILNHLKPVSNFLLNGYPKTDVEEKNFNQMLKNVTNFVVELLNREKNDSYYKLAMIFIDPIFKSVKKYHKQQIKDINKIIDEAVIKKISPTIKSGSEKKIGAQVGINDLIPPQLSKTLKFTIKNVKPSQSSKDGTSVIVTIEVSSGVANTAPKTYDIEMKGFLPHSNKKVKQPNENDDETTSKNNSTTTKNEHRPKST